MNRTFFIVFMLLARVGCGQEINITQGELGFLRGQTEIKVQFDYENIAIADGGSEKEYKSKKITYLNNKEAGRGDKWERQWNQFRIEHFEPSFKESLTKFSALKVNNETAPYTLIFKALMFQDQALLVPPDQEPNPTKKVAVLDGEVWIVETKNPTNVICKISMTKLPGRDAYLGTFGGTGATMANYDVRVRLSYTYAKAGKELGILITEKTK